jgi:hypothetical protein
MKGFTSISTNLKTYRLPMEHLKEHDENLLTSHQGRLTI